LNSSDRFVQELLCQNKTKVVSRKKVEIKEVGFQTEISFPNKKVGQDFPPLHLLSPLSCIQM
jgi:hypothetical protein